MVRQRMRSQSSPVARAVADALALVFGLALAWAGAMLVLLAFKVSPGTVDLVWGYRTAYDYLGNLQAQDITSSTRLIAAIAGLAAFVIFGFIAYRAFPRPYLARGDLRLEDDEGACVDVEPRAIERAAENAALAHPAVVAARARYAGDDVTIDVTARRANELDATLNDVHDRARDSLARHGLPPLPVNVTLVHLESKNRRELQ
ncbi:MAG: hypothetical protein KY463_07065 [Actinobacteria bacterium]|nr:hypothetical protein [Actinomycetota bacterium]